jgi:plasmid maintenance system killer protein
LISVHIEFTTEKLRKEFEDGRVLQRERGVVQAKKIMTRLMQLEGALTLEQLRNQPGHFHALTEDKSGWLACDLDQPFRLIFEVANVPVPQLDAGGIDWSKVTQVRILGVLNYHERNKKQPV